MNRRNKLATAMEILAALREGPLSPSLLAQRCNINYGRLHEALEPMQALGWISTVAWSGQEIHSLTDVGLRTFLAYESVWNDYMRALKLTRGQ